MKKNVMKISEKT